MGAERIAEVIESYLFLRDEADGGDVPVSHVARMADVSWKVAKRVILEVDGGIGDSRPGWLLNRPVGVGSRVGLSHEQECFILWLRFSDPFRSNEDYVRELYIKYGVQVSRMFVTRWFRNSFKKRGRLVTSELVPIDKMKFQNVVRYDDYCGYVRGVSTYRIVFVDEKSLKGCELYNRRGRSDPLTGEQPMQIVDSDFRNTYCLMGMITISHAKAKPIFYSLGECTECV